MNRTALAAFVAALCGAAAAPAAPPPPAETLRNAVEVLDELQAIPAKGIPAALLADAEAVAVIPRVIKAGLLIGGRAGHGVVVIRGRDGGWGEVRFVTLGGASLGFQAGVQSTDVVLVFRTRGGLGRLLSGRRELTLGGDAAVAAGPVGREAVAATDARLTAEVLSYSRSRGLFAGVSLSGAVIAADRRADQQFRRDDRPETQRAADALKLRLAELASAKPPPDRPARPPR